MKLKSILKNHVEYFINEQNKTVTAVCSIEDVIYTMQRDIYFDSGVNVPCYVKKRNGNLPEKLTYTARCSPEDVFDETIGERVAFELLYRNKVKPVIYDAISFWQKKLDRATNLIQTIVIKTSRNKTKIL